MRFFEFESREIVKRAGIPVTDYGFARSAQEAREIAERIGGPTVIKSQVLTGGRMKAGGVKFADTPEEAAAYAEEILELEINGHMPRGVLVDPKAELKQEYYAGVVWDGIRKQPVMLFSDMGGIDIEEVAEQHPDHVGRGHLSNLVEAPGLPRQGGDRADRRDRPRAHPRDADPRAAGAPVRRARHDACRDQPAGRARGRQLRRSRRPHGDGERGPPAPARAAEGAGRRRRGDPPGARGHALRDRGRGGRRDGPPRRRRQRDGVRRQPRPRDRRGRRLADPVRRGAEVRRQARELLRDRRQPVRRQGRRPGEARAVEAGRGQDRRDDEHRVQHARRHRRARRREGLPRARLRPGREDRDLPHPRRLGGRGLQDPREVRRRVLRPLRVDARGRAARGGEDPGLRRVGSPPK